MSHGGARKGAGRRTGAKNKNTAEMLAEIVASGETPRDYMLRVMRDGTVDHVRRDKMAVAVAPYIHPHLQAVEHTGENSGPIKIMIEGDDKSLL